MASCDRPAIPSDWAPEVTAMVLNIHIHTHTHTHTHTKDIGARRGSTLRRTNWQSVTHNATLASSDRTRRGCRVIACTRTWIPRKGYGYCLPQYGVTATRCTPPRVSQNGLHSSPSDPKQFLQGQAKFADSPTSSEGTRSRAYQQTFPCKRRWNILTDCDCGTGIIQCHDRICRGRESNRTTPEVSQMNWYQTHLEELHKTTV